MFLTRQSALLQAVVCLAIALAGSLAVGPVVLCLALTALCSAVWGAAARTRRAVRRECGALAAMALVVIRAQRFGLCGGDCCAVVCPRGRRRACGRACTRWCTRLREYCRATFVKPVLAHVVHPIQRAHAWYAGLRDDAVH